MAPDMTDGFLRKMEVAVKNGLDRKIKALPGTSFQQQMGKRKGLLIQVWLNVRCQ